MCGWACRVCCLTAAALLQSAGAGGGGRRDTLGGARRRRQRPHMGCVYNEVHSDTPLLPQRPQARYRGSNLASPSFACAGTGEFGQLGHENTLTRVLVPSPVQALGGMRVVGIAAGNRNSVFLTLHGNGA
jgi:hypothetical protein